MPQIPECLNILYVGTLPPHTGGSAVSCSQLLVGFAKFGHTVRALAPITAEALRSGDDFADSHPDIRVTRFEVPYFQTVTYLPPTDEYQRIERAKIQEMLPVLMKTERPDTIIIGRETFAWDVPALATVHSVPCILRISGGLALGILNGIYPEALAQQLLEQCRKADLTVAQAKHMAEGLRQLAFNNIKVIPNAVDLDQFSPKPKSGALLQELAIRDDDVAVVHVSNLKLIKRPLDLVDSAEEALRQDPRLVYVIVGEGECREPMEEACRQKRISERFRFVGWVDYQRVPDYINLADMVVMPSEFEQQSRVYLETQACARVILASDVPGARGVIVDGETGLLFRKGDIHDLTAKTLLAAGDPNLRTKIGRKARKRVKVHSIDRTVAAYLASFEEVIRHYHGNPNG